jgi:hypothetical protein
MIGLLRLSDALSTPSQDTTHGSLDFQYFERLEDKSIFTQVANDEQVAEFEAMLGRGLPEDLKIFVSKYGGVRTRSEYNLYGLGCPKSTSPSMVWALGWLSFLNNDFPEGLLPVGTVDWNEYACLELDPPGRVVRWIGGKALNEQKLEVIASNYADFVLRVSKELFILDHALSILRLRVEESEEKYHYDLGGKGKLPRNQDYRVHRFCSRDIILGVLALKLQKGSNCMIVDLFLPINIPPFEKDGSLIFMTLFLLGDAHRCGGTMEIRFSENVDGGQVPRKLQALAKSVGAEIKPVSVQNHKLDPDDSTRLYLALTGFSEQTKAHLEKNQINPVKACFVVHRGIWSISEVEFLLTTSPNPNRILDGGAQPEDWFDYQEDLQYSRSAVLSGYLSRRLSNRQNELLDEAKPETEDNNNDLSTGIIPSQLALVYQVYPPDYARDEAISIPWLLEGNHHQIEPGKKFIVLVRARKWMEFNIAFDNDLASAITLQEEHGCPVFLLVPRDFLDTHLDTQKEQWLRMAKDKNIGVIVCGESVTTLDEEVSRRWRSSKVIRD